VYQVAGIFQPDNKLRQFEDRCQKRMQALGVATLREYYECLTVRPIRQAELLSLLNEITIGETFFFRNQPQLDALRNVVLTRIVEVRKKMTLRHIRIWSAGCSTGEEPYTLSIMLMEELAGRLQGWTFEIVATDLNERSVAHAKAGLYGNYSTRNLTPEITKKYFSPAGENLQVNTEVKTHVSITRVNFLDDSRMVFLKGFDVIMCCNVLIYFDVLSKRRVIQHFYNNLLAHGYLLLGHSESLYGVNDDFRLVHLPSATAYVKSEERQLSL
jgi:chemotaxis protein methyltransferase CheR